MRWVLGIVGVLVVLVVVVLVVGALLPKSHVAAMSARYVAPPESLWVTLTDVNAFPTWRRDLERALDIFGRAVAWARIPICQTLVLAATSIARKYLRARPFLVLNTRH